MKIEYYSTPNSKGQVVIPKKLRDDLGITQSGLLHILKRGRGFYVYPVKEVIGAENSDLSYTAILSQTKGKWGRTDSNSHNADIELRASQNRKQAW